MSNSGSQTLRWIRAVASGVVGGKRERLDRLPAAVAIGLVLSGAPASGQSEPEAQRFLRTYDEVETAKRVFATALLGVVSDLDGRFGNEGYRLRTALDTMQASLIAWNGGVHTLESLSRSLDSAGASLALARVYLDQHRLEDARRETQRAVALDAARADGYELLGVISLDGSDPAEATEAFRQATLADPNDALAFYELASAHLALAQPTAAAAARVGFAAAAERRLGPLWSMPGQRLTETAPVLGEPSRFVMRRAPVDLVANAGGAFAGFMPSAYEGAAVLVAAGDYAGAVSALRAAVGGDALTRAIAGLSDDHGPQLNSADAITQLETAVTQHPESSEARRLLGQAFWLAEDVASAVQQFSAGLALAPGDERLRTARQAALLLATPNDPVAAEFAATAAAHPRSGVARQTLGRFLQDAGRNAEALAAYREALQRAPLVAVARLHLRIAEIYAQQLQLDEAIGSFRAALAIDRNNLLPREWIARLLMEDGQLDESYAEYLVILLLDPLNGEAHARMAQIQLQRGAFVKAVALARRALTQEPEHMQARYALGQALLRSGAVEEGRSEIAEYARRQAVAQDAERRQRELGALNEKALALAGAGELDGALDLLRKAVDLDPSGMAHLNLGLALMEAGRVADAIDRFEAAAAVLDDAEAVHLYLADAYAEVGRSDDSARARALHEQMRIERLRRSQPSSRNQ